MNSIKQKIWKNIITCDVIIIIVTITFIITI